MISLKLHWIVKSSLKTYTYMISAESFCRCPHSIWNFLETFWQSSPLWSIAFCNTCHLWLQPQQCSLQNSLLTQLCIHGWVTTLLYSLSHPYLVIGLFPVTAGWFLNSNLCIVVEQDSTLQHYTGYKASELKECVTALHELQCNTKKCTLPAIREKYCQHKVNLHCTFCQMHDWVWLFHLRNGCSDIDFCPAVQMCIQASASNCSASWVLLWYQIGFLPCQDRVMTLKQPSGSSARSWPKAYS